LNVQGMSNPSSLSNNVLPFASVPGKPTYLGTNPQPLAADVSFVPPADDGGSPILYYYVKTTPSRETQAMGDSLPAGWNVGLMSPVHVTHLLPQFYQFQVVAHNLYGDSQPSDLPISVPVGVGTPDAPTEVYASGDGDSAVKVYFQEPLFDGGVPVRNYTVTSNPGQYRVITLTSPALFTDMPEGTYRFIVYATNTVGDSPPSLQSNSVTISSHTSALLPLWIVLGILGFIGICVCLYCLRHCLIVRKNRNNDKLAKQTNDGGDAELVIVKDVEGKGTTNDESHTVTGIDAAEGTTATTNATSKAIGASSLDPDDESNWVSHQ